MECLTSMPSSSRATLPRGERPLMTVALSLRKEAGRPYESEAEKKAWTTSAVEGREGDRVQEQSGGVIEQVEDLDRATVGQLP